MSFEKYPVQHRDLLRDFEQHLQTTCGLTAGSAALRTWHASRFLAVRYGDRKPDLRALRPLDAVEYITGLTPLWNPNTRKSAVGTLRSFFRWLKIGGLCTSELAESVPTVSSRRYSEIPVHISPTQLDALLRAFDLNKPIGLRGYAAALCMARLGLRVGEVARLTLDDIDWRCGTLRLPTTKGRRERILPLPHTVGKALVDYLRKGRPRTNERHIFVNHSSYGGKPPCTHSLRADIRSAFDRADPDAPAKGTRVLRHTAATNLIRSGATLKKIADVLGHSSIDTTRIYAKVDIPTLRELASNWPMEVLT